jgi:hypothetical protein
MRPGQLRQQGNQFSTCRAGPWVEAEASKSNHGSYTLQQGRTS